MWIEHCNRFFELITDCLHWRGEIGITGDKRKGVCGLGYCVHQHFCRDIYIGSFFFEFHDGGEVIRNQRAAFAGFFVKGHEPFRFLIEAFNDLDSGDG